MSKRPLDDLEVGGFCATRTYSKDVAIKSAAASGLTIFLIYTSITLNTSFLTEDNASLRGIGLFCFFFFLSMAMNYGLLSKCEFRQALPETLMAAGISFLISAVVMFFMGHNMLHEIPHFFSSDLLVGTIVGMLGINFFNALSSQNFIAGAS